MSIESTHEQIVKNLSPESLARALKFTNAIRSRIVNPEVPVSPASGDSHGIATSSMANPYAEPEFPIDKAGTVGRILNDSRQG